jgi:autotransporter-associated beta strand protein
VTLATAFGGSGTGSVTKAGSGTLTFTGNNSYSGGTTITAGTLQIGNNATTGTLGSGAVTDNASLAFDLNGTATIANAISGSGTVAQSSSGTLVLTGSNSYAGTTTPHRSGKSGGKSLSSGRAARHRRTSGLPVLNDHARRGS